MVDVKSESLPIADLKGKRRDAGPEFLRIFAMLLIIMSHLAVHGGIKYDALTFNSALLEMMKTGDIGVDIFILISGYYSIYSAPRLKKGVMLICQTLFYSILTFAVGCAVSAVDFSKEYLMFSFLPFVSDKGNWFIVIYIIMYTLIPFINGGLKNLNKRTYLGLLALIFAISTILPDTFGVVFKMQDYGSSKLVWFVFMYSLGAYLRLYPIRLESNRKLCAFLWILSIGFTALFRYFYAVDIYTPNGFFYGIPRLIVCFFSDISRPGFMSVVFSVLSFLLFNSVKNIKGNKLLYAVSGSTFGIYLIHDNSWTRRYLWDNIANLKPIKNSAYFLPAAILAISVIFIVCGVFDIVRKYVLEKPIFSSGLCAKAESAFKKGVDKLLTAVGI